MRNGLCFVALSLCLVVPELSHGAIFNVTNETELQSALDDASASAEDDTINIAAGQYLTSNNGNNPFSYPAPVAPAGSLTLRGAGMDVTILDGGNSTPVMEIGDFESTGTMIIEDITFQNGNGNGIGGLGINLGGNTAMDLTIQNCAIQNNTSDDTTAGAGIQNLGGPITFHNNLVTGNQSILIDGTGGAFFSMDTDPLIITNSIFFDNLGGRSGGVAALSSGGNPVTLTNNTIVGNTADQLMDSTGGLELSLGTTSTADIFNNIIFGNTATMNPDGNDILNESDVPTVINLFNNDFSDFDDNTGATVNEGSNLDLDPDLVDPAGGNFELNSLSPVIDQGDPAAPQMPSMDFAGNPRPAIPGTNPDMGALEFQPAPTPTPTPFPIIDLAGSGCGIAVAPFHGEVGLLFLTLLTLGLALRRSKS